MVRLLKTKIFINSELFAYCDNPYEFTQKMREYRRKGLISHEMTITYYEKDNKIYIYTDNGRALRPLIIVEDGMPLLNDDHIEKISYGYLKWDDLLDLGVVEFLDAEEEENSYIAMGLNDLNQNHTHLEINPATIFGICAGIIPFLNHNLSSRNTKGSSLIKQSFDTYSSFHKFRSDPHNNYLHHPQRPLVSTKNGDYINYDLNPTGQNLVVAVLSYEGYNIEDSIIFNKASLERGLGRSTFFRNYQAFEKRYPGGQEDVFEIPDKNMKGYRSYDAYKNLNEDGIIKLETYVESGDILVGKTSPPRFLGEFDELATAQEKRRESSITVRSGEKGIVDSVIFTHTPEAINMVNVKVRDTRQPELGDKFSTRHGIKGVVGLIVPPEDIPFTEFGIVPDVIINPHAITHKMTVGQVFEMLFGKIACFEGYLINGTTFNDGILNYVRQILFDNGFESGGCESLYDGKTGERFESEIFMGISYYHKLIHMVADKIYARSIGPVEVLSRQPTEGRSRDGGLRFGEMEKDCLIAHGAAMTLKERLLDASDKYEALVCNNCGMLAIYDRNRDKIYCPICGDVEAYPVEISYAFKILLDELKSMCISPKLILGDKF